GTFASTGAARIAIGKRYRVSRRNLQFVASGHVSGIPTYQELRRGWVNTAALLGSGSLIRYESVPEGLRPLGGEVARVSARSRGERSRPACGRSVSGGQPNDDENRVVLLVAAVHGRHGRPRIHRKTLRGSV